MYRPNIVQAKVSEKHNQTRRWTRPEHRTPFLTGPVANFKDQHVIVSANFKDQSINVFANFKDQYVIVSANFKDQSITVFANFKDQYISLFPDKLKLKEYQLQ